jgi:hypothetical protein
MITSGRITTSTITAPETIYTSSGTNAITTIVLCNTGTVDPADESSDLANINIYLVKYGQSPTLSNVVVWNLPVPAGETVFFSEERIVLDNGDTIRVGADAANLITVTVSSLIV